MVTKPAEESWTVDTVFDLEDIYLGMWQKFFQLEDQFDAKTSTLLGRN